MYWLCGLDFVSSCFWCFSRVLVIVSFVLSIDLAYVLFDYLYFRFRSLHYAQHWPWHAWHWTISVLIFVDISSLAFMLCGFTVASVLVGFPFCNLPDYRRQIFWRGHNVTQLTAVAVANGDGCIGMLWTSLASSWETNRYHRPWCDDMNGTQLVGYNTACVNQTVSESALAVECFT